MTQNAFAFAASAMIPIGQASTAGNLTFKSTATIVAKEGISRAGIAQEDNHRCEEMIQQEWVAVWLRVE